MNNLKLIILSVPCVSKSSCSSSFYCNSKYCHLTSAFRTVAKCMRSLGFGVIETIGSSDGRVDRVDSCGLYFREEKWACLNHETIRLDDLAILRSSSGSKGGEGNANKATLNQAENIDRRRGRNGDKRGQGNNGSLKGFERSFVRKNVTLVARMEHKLSRRQIVVVVSHLFWNPAYDYVKVGTLNFIFSTHEIFKPGDC